MHNVYILYLDLYNFVQSIFKVLNKILHEFFLTVMEYYILKF